MDYVRNDIVKPFKVKIIRYTERIREMHDLEKYLPPPQMKGQSAMAANWNVCNKKFTISDLRLSIKDRLPKSMRDELDDHPEEYSSLIQVKYGLKRASVQIKKIASARADSMSDSD